MYKGITPTFTLTLPESVDLSTAANVYVSFASKVCDVSLQKSGDELTVERNVVSVFLTQEETLSFPRGETAVQINWTYQEADVTKRACSTIATVTWTDNLINEVIA